MQVIPDTVPFAIHCSEEPVHGALSAPSWPTGTVVIAGIDALTSPEYQAVCAGPNTDVDRDHGNDPATVHATSSRWRPKPAYNTTVEASVYCRPEAVGRGCGTALYKALFTALEREDVRTVVAGVSLPNPASLSFHEKFGFRPVGVFHAVGRKFDRFWDVAWFERPFRLPDA